MKREEEVYKTIQKYFTEKSIFLSLSKREHEVLLYWISDYNYKQISRSLCISESTVRTHIQNINYKLNASSKAAIAVSLLLEIINTIT
jgi:DNA-binding CsgD family transcriptional regulator